VYYSSILGALVSGNIFCAYISGTLCGLLLPWLLVKCARNSLLPTSTAIISVGVSAVLAGLISSVFCIPMTLLTNFIFEKVYEAASTAAVDMFGSVFIGFTLFGAVLGWGISWGSEEGYYHLVMLPLIAVYMDHGNFSVLGTLDMLCLCVPCAGVCSAVYGIGVLRSALSPLPVSAEEVTNEEEEPAEISVIDAVCIATDSDSTMDIGDLIETALPEPSSSTWRPTPKSLKGMTWEPSISSSLQVSNKYFLSTSSGSSSVLGSDRGSDETEAIDQTSCPVSSCPSPFPSPPRMCDENSSSLGSLSPLFDDGSISLPSHTFPEISQEEIPIESPLKFDGYHHHIRLGWKGTISNLLMGDYVEACYPYTLSNRWVLCSVRASSAIAGGLILGYFGVIGDCKEGAGLGSSSSAAMVYERGRVTHYSTSCGSSSSGRDYSLQSSAYLPLPLSMILALNGHQPTCMSGTKLPPYVSYLPTDISDIQILNASYHFILMVFSQMMNYDHPGAYGALVAAVLLSYSIPFLTTLIVYSGKGKLKLKEDVQ
jgi:hypothetical protein